MPFELTAAAGRRRIAVIGGGISGMGAAYHLARDNHVTLFEAEPRLGGHARTILAGPDADQPVDTGFIVFNYANYPHLTALFDELDVPVCPSDMSFAASLQGGRIEYGLRNLAALFAQPANVMRPKFLRMLRDIARFNALALDRAIDRQEPLGDFLDALGMGDWFRRYYLLPLSGAIWSTPAEKILDFPAYALVRFFENHALLSHEGQHQWYTVDGGSIQYVTRLQSALQMRGVSLRLGCPIQSATRNALGAEICAEGASEHFDEVVMATHSDVALHLLKDATGIERAGLSAVRYQPNEMVLHSDASVMPRRRACWSSWNYTEAQGKTTDRIDLTYWMNSLQALPAGRDYFVTLNATRAIREDLIWDRATFAHPVYELETLAAQDLLRANNGTNHTWFCGAWMKNGFHEDGLSSAVDVAEALQAQRGFAVAAE